MIFAEQVKKGNFIKQNKNMYTVFEKKVYSSDNNLELVDMQLFNINSGETSTCTFEAKQEIEKIDLDMKSMKLTRKSDESLVFCDEDSGDELEIKISMLGRKASFLSEKSSLEVFYYNEMIISVELPQVVVFEIDETEDIEKDSSNLDYIKSARLNNGQTIKVPAFIKTGDKVRIHSETGEYISRD